MSTQKKKVAILTRHDVPNYGSFLQTLATQKIMEDLSFDPTIIDYKREDDSTDALIRQYSNEHKNILYKIYYHTLWRYSHSHIERVMKRERDKYLHCSKPVNKMTIKQILGNYDIYMTGSDQVWNIVGSGNTKEIDNVYFWDDLPDGSNVFSYAASFGDSKLNAEDYIKCQNGLRKFKHISVREDSGIDLIREMGYKATQVIDPTMLVKTEYWDNIAESASICPKQQYALVYNLHSDSNINDYIINDLKDSELDIYNITTTFRKGMGKNVFCPPIQDFLYLFKNANVVYADSFHAIAFSILFNTPIVVILPRQYSTRLESILNLFGLEDCIVNNTVSERQRKRSIDWSCVNLKLEEERKRSREWLKNVTAEMVKL